ncbi:MAG: DUF1294 domain-containing protein [Pontiellaceae bacterium]|jgi:uncharacterized membrane protein YsdA (DUF1294 family)/cold shock CspA family protein|nr:DUF1294 domain-containing protein [Pontiellaceae bacterium]
MKNKTYKSTVISWKSGQGYGFMKNPNGGSDLFLHINDIQGKREPDCGDFVRFRLKTDEKGKTVVYGARLIQFTALSAMSWITTVAIAGLPFILSLITLKRTPFPLILYSCMGTLCFFMMKTDKRRAEEGRWRISDDSIHLAQLLWGWPGTLIAQKIYLHKARKKPFQGTLNFIIFLHILFWVDYLALDHLILKNVILLLEQVATD